MSARLRLERADAPAAALLPFDEQTALDVAAGRRAAYALTAEPADGAEAGPLGWGVVGAGALDLFVAPGVRGRGYGSTAADELLARAGDGELTAWSHGDHPAARAIAGRRGFAAVRHLLKLKKHIDAAATARAAGAAAADGQSFAAFRPGADDGAWLSANARAFAGHPEQGSLTAADLAERMAEPWFDPAGFVLAHDADGRLTGFCWTKIEPGSNAGEIYVIGVEPDASGRGLGRALLRAGIAHLAARGVAIVELYVEAGNERALALYRAAGFELAETHVQYRRPARDVPLA